MRVEKNAFGKKVIECYGTQFELKVGKIEDMAIFGEYFTRTSGRKPTALAVGGMA